MKLVLVFCAAFALGLAHVAQIRDTPTFTSPLVDAYTYDQSARRIAAEGPGALETPYYQPPAYPMLLGGLHRLTGGDFLAPRVANAALSAAAAALVYSLAAGVAGTFAGFTAAFLFAASGLVLYFVGELLPVSLILFLHTAAIALAVRADASPRPVAPLAAAGALLGLAAGARPTALHLAGAIGWWWTRGAPAPGRGRALAAAALACAVLIAPWTLANVLRGGENVLISWNGGINFYLGNGASSDSLTAIQPGFGWDRLQVEPRRAGVASHAEESRYWFRRGVREAAADPAAWAGALGRKVVRLFAARETPRNTDWEAFRDSSRILSLPLPGFWLVAPLALAAWLRGAVPGRLRSLLGLALAIVAIQNLAFFVAERYRLEAAPVLCILAGLAAGDLRRRAPGRPGAWPRPAALAAAALLAVFSGIDWLGERPVDAAREAIHRGVALRRLERTVPARAEFEEAVRIAPADPDAHRWLGEIASGEGRFEEALDHFDRALAAAPDYVRALLGRAQTLERMGRRPEAEESYRSALNADPWSPDVHLNYGVWLAIAGRREEAERHFETGLRLSPGDERFLRNLQRLRQGL